MCANHIQRAIDEKEDKKKIFLYSGIGILKKLVILSRAGVIVDTIYSDTLRYDGFYIWEAAALFMLHLYTDFSGCMDIVIGASECSNELGLDNLFELADKAVALVDYESGMISQTK